MCFLHTIAIYICVANYEAAVIFSKHKHKLVDHISCKLNIQEKVTSASDYFKQIRIESISCKICHYVENKLSINHFHDHVKRYF